MTITSRMFTVLFYLVAGDPLSAQSRPATQPMGERLLWEQSYQIRQHPLARRIQPLKGKGYRIVGKASWTKDATAPLDDRYGFEFFLLDVDQQGHQMSVSAIESIPLHREQIWDCAISGDDLFVTGDRSWFGHIDPPGRLQHTAKLESPSKGFPDPRCILACGKARFLVAGSLSFKDVWVAEVNAEGKALWEKTFDHGANECAYAVVGRPDGGFVLAANSGEYNKFGQGPSKVWLVTCDAEGNKESETTLPDARLQPFGNPILVWVGDGCVVAFSRTQLPPINQIPMCSLPAFNWCIASFDQKLNLIREKEIRPTTSMSSLLVTRPNGGLVSIGAVADGLSIVEISPEGESQQETVIPLSGILQPVDVLAEKETLTILMNCTFVNQEPTKRIENMVRLMQIRL